MSKFLDAHRIEIGETVPASRKLGRAEAAALLERASEIYIAKGKKLERFPGGRASENIVARMLGPTGNLRSPTVRVGRTLIVGFDEETLLQSLESVQRGLVQVECRSHPCDVMSARIRYQ